MSKTIAKQPVGRPTLKWKAAEKIFKLAKEGKTPEQMAEIIGVTSRTIRKWKAEDWEFASTLRENEAIANQLVEFSLFERARGYAHLEEKIFCVEGEIVRATTMKQYPPDTVAAMNWLTNRDGGRWKRAQDDIPAGHNIQVNFNFPRPDTSPKVIDGTIIPAARK